MKEKQNNWLIVLSIPIIIILIILIVYLARTPSNLSKELNDMGYKTKSEEEAFYKKIITNNTLDDYYNDIANQRESNYEEYYFVKESYDYIELKMAYQNNQTQTLTITSNLKNLKTTYNYEMSKDDTYILLEGNNTEQFFCHVITQKNTNEEEINLHCQEVQNEVQKFLSKRDELLTNKQITNIINK